MNETEEAIRVYEPDRSLQIKVGVTNLDHVFTSKAISAAQAVIEESAEDFLNDSLELMEDLVVSYQAVLNYPAPVKNPFISKIVDASFSLKTKTGQGGYIMASVLAKSLQLHAEQADVEGLSPRTLEIMGWHIESIQQFLSMKLKGTGGETGDAILRELRRISPSQPKLFTVADC